MTMVWGWCVFVLKSRGACGSLVKSHPLTGGRPFPSPHAFACGPVGFHVLTILSSQRVLVVFPFALPAARSQTSYRLLRFNNKPIISDKYLNPWQDGADNGTHCGARHELTNRHVYLHKPVFPSHDTSSPQRRRRYAGGPYETLHSGGLIRTQIF